MKIRFYYDDAELYSHESNDVSGVIQAAKGEKVVFHDDFFKYDYHVLNHYVEGGNWKQEVNIYLRRS